MLNWMQPGFFGEEGRVTIPLAKLEGMAARKEPEGRVFAVRQLIGTLVDVNSGC
jgi:hypothetical protein